MEDLRDRVDDDIERRMFNNPSSCTEMYTVQDLGRHQMK